MTKIMRRLLTNGRGRGRGRGIGAHTSVIGMPNGGTGQTEIGEGPTGIRKTTVGVVNRDRSRDSRDGFTSEGD